MATLKYWVWLSALTELLPKTRYELICAFGDPESVFFADEKQLSKHISLNERERRVLSDKGLERANEILEKCHEDGIAIITMADAVYPRRLLNIFDPPIVLYVKGRLPSMDEQAAIGIVGTRKATPYGMKMSRKIGFEVAKGGGLVVTGLAGGADSAAAEGALRAGGFCVGVLGCAINEVYPAWNEPLFNDVSAMGALVSEYPQGTAGASRYFPERNRIISGLSVGVAVVEAPFRSGALITASRALDQGREVFAVPGNADAPNSAGTNQLIRDGAQLVCCGWDILQEFEQQFPDKVHRPDPQKLNVSHEKDSDTAAKNQETKPAVSQRNLPETGKNFAMLRVQTGRKRIDNKNRREYIDLKEQLAGLSEQQLKIVAIMDEKEKHVDDIIELSGLSASTVLSELTILQIKGIVSQESGKRFTLNIVKK